MANENWEAPGTCCVTVGMYVPGCLTCWQPPPQKHLREGGQVLPPTHHIQAHLPWTQLALSAGLGGIPSNQLVCCPYPLVSGFPALHNLSIRAKYLCRFPFSGDVESRPLQRNGKKKRYVTASRGLNCPDMGWPWGGSCCPWCVCHPSRAEAPLQAPHGGAASVVFHLTQKSRSGDICFVPGFTDLLTPRNSKGYLRSSCEATSTHHSAVPQPSNFSPSEHLQPFQKQMVTY